jgi:hypothetical protein
MITQLPAAPTDTEKVSYLHSHPVAMLLASMASFACAMASAIHFLINNPLLAPIAAKAPLLLTEFGIGLHGAACDATEMIEMLKWMDTHEAGYMAFSWNAGGQECGSLALIRDHNGTPHAPNGTAYKDYLAQILGAA